MIRLRGGEVFAPVVGADHEVVPVAADEKICGEAGPAAHGIVAGLFENVVALLEEDVSPSPRSTVVASTLEAIVAAVAVERVVADVRWSDRRGRRR